MNEVREGYILRLQQLIARIGLSKSAIWDRMNANSPRYDATFPKPIKLGGRAVGWIDYEVSAWVQSRIDAR